MELGLKQAPANVYRNITPDEAIAISYYNNQNQKTFKPETFLDLAHQVHNLKQEGRSLETIGGIFGMSRFNVTQLCAIKAKLADDVLNRVETTFVALDFTEATKDENTQATNNVAQATIDWQFTWFRHITPLSHKQCRQRNVQKKDAVIFQVC